MVRQGAELFVTARRVAGVRRHRTDLQSAADAACGMPSSTSPSSTRCSTIRRRVEPLRSTSTISSARCHLHDGRPPLSSAAEVAQADSRGRCEWTRSSSNSDEIRLAWPCALISLLLICSCRSVLDSAAPDASTITALMTDVAVHSSAVAILVILTVLHRAVYR